MDTEKIKAIASLWPLALIVFLTFFAIMFRKQLMSLFQRLAMFKFKRGQTEFTISQETKEIETKPEIQSEEKPSAEKQATEMSDKTQALEPKTSKEWALEMFKAFSARNMEEAKIAFNRMQDSETNAVKKLKNESVYLFLCYQYGDTSALGKLQSLAEKEEASAQAYYWIAKCHEEVGDFDRAVEAYKISAKHSEKEIERAPIIVSISNCLYKAAKQQEGYTNIMQEIGKVTDADAVSTLYEGLASLYELANNYELRGIALEKALENRPNDTNLLFRAAYSYSQVDLNALSLLHYKMSLQFDPDDSTTLNNVAVQYKSLKMLMRAVKFYKKSFELNNTLAASNLAFQFMNAGFVEEASETLNKAKQQKDLHPNVGSAISAVSEKEEAESKLEENTINVAREQQRFLLPFAEAYFTAKPNIPNFSGVWRSSDGLEILITQTKDEIIANWVYDKKKYKFTGNISNRAAKVITYKMEYFGSSTELGFFKDGYAYAYLSADGQELSIMTLKENVHSLMMLSRVE